MFYRIKKIVTVLIAALLFIVKWPFAFLLLLTDYMVFSHLSSFLKALNKQVLLKDAIVFFVSFFIYRTLLQKRMKFWETLFHELAHLIFGVLTFNRITNINASDGEGGVVRYQGYPNWLLTIAPYVFPVLTFLLLILYIFSKSIYHSTLHYLIICSFAMYVAQVIKEFGPNWGNASWFSIGVKTDADLERVGHLFAIFVLPAANFLWGFFLVFFLQGKSNFFFSIVKGCLINYLLTFLEFFKHLI